MDEFDVYITINYKGRSKVAIVKSMRETTLYDVWKNFKNGRPDITFSFTRIKTRTEKVREAEEEELE